ncbi:DUF1501 domain-containing protein [Nannocystis sp. ILAH1]|uniref:DUF1501 domain-containing protein n=1 Tax=unclassified Nannocystis TaxID=2627009 RepID=UPI002270F966|nr:MULTISPECIES: DUF1501 domain-containing protein [unclassified Nannocystis]MCY0991589.1 DUF1501 domain-containing protein [Nannocystis sp. ILAH1]MCY1066638.1 DUF1501 domain-containing protein [Nannocystis sp. RBIL2]
MDRRNFLKIAAMTGLAVAAPVGVRRALADAEPYEGPFFVLISASGGWDPVYLCDPKEQGPLNRLYSAAATQGNISYAPIGLDPVALGLEEAEVAYLMSNTDFFTKYASRLLVLNGVDMATNNHDAGARATWSGRLPEGFPSFGALVAAARAPESTFAYVSAGGFDATEGLVPLTRISSVDAVKKIANPNLTDPNSAETEKFHSDKTMERIRKAQTARLEAQMAAARLPRAKAAMNELFLSRGGEKLLKGLTLPAEPATLPGYQLGDLQGFMQQSQFAVAAFKAKMAVAANLNLGGFDTHGNHDRDHVRQLAKLLAGVDFFMQEAEAAGIADKLTVIVGSDFARGPGYNGDNEYAGKDHWSVTSVMMMGKGIKGNRVVGATDAEQYGALVDPASLAVGKGKKLTPESIHLALRKLAGIDTADVTARFPLAGEDMPKLLAG